MNFYTLSLFPNLINSSLEEGVIKKAINNKYINIVNYDLRKFGVGRNKQLDDTNYGGGPGMVMRPDVVDNTIKKILENVESKLPLVYMTPVGEPLSQKKLELFAKVEGVKAVSYTNLKLPTKA